MVYALSRVTVHFRPLTAASGGRPRNQKSIGNHWTEKLITTLTHQKKKFIFSLGLGLQHILIHMEVASNIWKALDLVFSWVAWQCNGVKIEYPYTHNPITELDRWVGEGVGASPVSPDFSFYFHQPSSTFVVLRARQHGIHLICFEDRQAQWWWFRKPQHCFLDKSHQLW